MPKWQAQRLLVVAIATMVFLKYREHSTDHQDTKSGPEQVDIVRIMKFVCFAIIVSAAIIGNGYVLVAVVLALPSLGLMYFVVQENRTRQEHYQNIIKRR